MMLVFGQPLTTYSSRPWGEVMVFAVTLSCHGCSIRRYAATFDRGAR